MTLDLFDYDTLSALTSWNISIYKEDVLIYTNTSSNTFQLLYNDTYQGLLKVKFFKTGYNPSYYWFDFQSGSTVDQDIYLLSDSSNTLMPITIKDLLGSRYIEGASVSLYGVKSDTDYFLTEEYTDSAGKVYFNLNDSYSYKLIVSKDGYLTTNYRISPLESSYTFLIPEDSTNYGFVYEGFSFKVDLYDLNNVSYLRARYNDEDDLINKITLNVISSDWSSSNYSIDSTSDTILISLPTNTTAYNYFETNLVVLRNSVSSTFYENFDLGISPIIESVDYLEEDSQSTESNKNLINIVVLLFLAIAGFVVWGENGSLLFISIGSIILWYLEILSPYLMVPIVLFAILKLGFYRGGEY
jgi:hypothetical protein